MKWIDQLTKEKTGGTVGQATQMVVGAADESDQQIFQRIDQLYTDWNMKRVYYAPFRPARYTPLEEHPPVPSMREHRLYQMDWLKRVYQFSNDEIGLAFDRSGFLSLEQDPKTVIAVENLESFPVDVNAATREQLLRVPGVGPTSTDRILENRQRHSIDNWRDLQAMGVVRKRAWPFLIFSGHRPPRAKQLRLDLFNEAAGFGERESQRPAQGSALASAATPASGLAPCGQATSCTGCPMYGAPGHPGSMG
jgi:predicted DNA-binding helix-hairpin-helix protein